MAIDDTGARRLIAAILKQAHEDYKDTDECPPWCIYSSECAERKIDKNFCDAKKFIHSAWAAALCDAIDIEYAKYVEVAMDKCRLNKNTIDFLEGELRAYKATKRELEELRNKILQSSPVQQEGRNYSPGDSTGHKAIALLMDKKIKRHQRIVDAINFIYQRCETKKQTLMAEYYFERRYTQEGIAYKLGVDRSTIHRWKKQIIYALAVKLGFL